jgi:hypothetical protein
MRSKLWIVTLLLAALTGCGGGGGDSAPPPPPFVIWAGSSNGDHVVDANNHAFAFFADSGCLFNFQTGRENPNFCLTTAADTALYGPLRVRIANILSADGTCIAALLDEATGHFLDIELDSFGNEVAIITELHPVLCLT